MPRAKRTSVPDLNQHITCKLCGGYYVDATTIIECLHSFCRSCIVEYLRTNKYCPVCDVQVHKTKPLLNIRPDRILQDVVYKVVPKLFHAEFQRRRAFLQAHPESRADFERFVDAHQHLAPSDESISVTLSYHQSKESTRYLRCPTAVSIGHLQKLLRAKYGLADSIYHIDLLYNQVDSLDSDLTLTDVAYIYKWKRKAPLELTYRIYDKGFKRPRSGPESGPTKRKHSNNNWKEVQLRISENGEMSITGIQDGAVELVNNNNNNKKATVDTSKVTADAPKVTIEASKVKDEKANITEVMETKAKVTETKAKVTIETSSQNVTVVTSTPAKTAHSSIDKKCVVTSQHQRKSDGSPNAKNLKRKSNDDDKDGGASDRKQPKQTILNLCGNLLINRQQQEQHQQQNKAGKDEAAVKTVKSPCYMPKPNVINVPKPGPSPAQSNASKVTAPVSKVTAPVSKVTAPVSKVAVPVVKVTAPVVKVTAAPPSLSPVVVATTKPLPNLNAIGSPQSSKGRSKSGGSGGPIGYKTLRDPPKSWNSQISRANLNPQNANTSKGGGGGNGDAVSTSRPAKFFKMRNNMPRYLGNPASGVKPMYQVHESPEKGKAVSAATAAAITAPPAAKSEIKRHSIVKVDPKTLRPIAERAPEVSSLSVMGDLRINTSSVSIINPLKLQGSPKMAASGLGAERKSPKSPHSPKVSKGGGLSAAAGSHSPPIGGINKREKLNLSFTQSNPFIPMSHPNRFLFPAAPFPPYDPRMMAAYHNFLYGQRMPFPLGLGDPSAAVVAAAAAASAAASVGNIGAGNHGRNSKFDLPSPGGSSSCNSNNGKQPQHSPQPSSKFASGSSAAVTNEQSSSSSSNRNNFNCITTSSGSKSRNHLPQLLSASTIPTSTTITSTMSTTTTTITTQAQTPIKKSAKESGGNSKNEKSLQNAVEKLTHQQQNKANREVMKKNREIDEKRSAKEREDFEKNKKEDKPPPAITTTATAATSSSPTITSATSSSTRPSQDGAQVAVADETSKSVPVGKVEICNNEKKSESVGEKPVESDVSCPKSTPPPSTVTTTDATTVTSANTITVVTTSTSATTVTSANTVTSATAVTSSTTVTAAVTSAAAVATVTTTAIASAAVTTVVSTVATTRQADSKPVALVTTPVVDVTVVTDGSETAKSEVATETSSEKTAVEKLEGDVKSDDRSEKLVEKKENAKETVGIEKVVENDGENKVAN